MAIALIPLLAFVGSAVDTARLYVVKVRMQQACDAGALAGRKFMTATTGTALDTNSQTQATAFFNNNFKAGIFAATSITSSFTRTSDGQVAGTASATVPMTLTSMMGFSSNTITVTCQARYDVSDIDVMFVLDNTGSMAYAPSDTNYSGQAVLSYTRSDGSTGYYNQEKSNARIVALRSAVLSFYDTLAAAANTSTHIRYGFVPYTSTTNVGYLISAVSSSYLLSGNYNYQTRKVTGDSNSGFPSNTTTTHVTQTTCNGNAGRTPATGYTSSGTAVVKTVSWTSPNSGTCVVTSQTVIPQWTYGQFPLDTSGYVTGATVTDPTEVTGATTHWLGCIEERDTQSLSTFDQNNLPYDLDPDLTPTSDATRWRPMWPDVEYDRNSTSNVVTTNNLENFNGTTDQQGGYNTCPAAATRLAVMARSDVNTYVNSLKAIGGTYHDTGMIWGTRLINPNGIFAADTAAWPGRNPPARHIVFMTDGEMAPSTEIYGMYGLEKNDMRVTGSSSNFSSLTNYHNARFLAECEAAKRRGITVWVIALGEAMTTQEQSCASTSGNAFFASSSTQLTAAFQTIATRVAQLRISQ